jgi:iron complex transport system substrate-binding protein
MNKILLFITSGILLFGTACKSDKASEKSPSASNLQITPQTKIVSLNGTLTEILCSFGWEQNIVGVDATSTYPESVGAKPQVGHNRNLSAEAIIALQPNIVVGVAEFIKPELIEQLTRTGSRVVIFHPQHSLEGAQNLIRAVADSFQYTGEVQRLVTQIETDKAIAQPLSQPPKVLFIYARGAGTLLASGTNTPVHNMIGLTGAQNAVTDYEDFKPLTSEGLVAANPDVILMFDSGLESLGGMSGLLAIPGVSQTTAGKTKRVVEMDGQFLTGFGPRTGKAIATLSQKLHEATGH